MEPKYVELQRSKIKGKKLTAIFYDKNEKRIKTTHFGEAGASDYTIHKDKDRMERYITRHEKNEDWTDPMKAGTLSRYILWSEPSLDDSVRDYINKFNLELL